MSSFVGGAGRVLLLASSVFTMSVIGAAPAQAHAVHVGDDPSNWHSTIERVQPEPRALRVSLGDAAQRLTVTTSGATPVVVLGYDGEPFLRLDRSGAWTNERSTTTWAVARPRVLPPRDVDDHAAPRWKRVNDAPSWQWHDARTHWAGYALPPPVEQHPERRQFVASWVVPILVDGQRGFVTGSLDWVPGPNPAPGAAFIVGPLLTLVLAGFLRRWRWAAAGALVIVTAADVVHAAGMVTGRVGGTWTRLAALPGHGVVSLLLWTAMSACAVEIARRRHVTGAVYGAAMLAAVVFLADGVPSIALVWRSQAITGLPISVDRYLVAALTGSSLGLLISSVLLIRRLDRRPPPRPRLQGASAA